jgi:hypothetical protein
MSKRIVLSIDSTTPIPVPAGRTFAGFLFRLRSASGGEASSGVVVDQSFGFDNATPGTYTAIVAAVDATGSPLGSEVTVTVTVTADEPPPPPATYPQPNGLSAVVV